MTTTTALLIELGTETYIVRYRPQDYDRALIACYRWTQNPELPAFGALALKAAADQILAVAQADGLLTPIRRPKPSWRDWVAKVFGVKA